MENSIINDYFCYHIIPFAYNKDYTEAKKDLDKKYIGDSKQWERTKFNLAQRLFEHVKKLIDDSDDSNETIGIRYEFKDSHGELIGFSVNDNNKLIFKYSDNKKEYEYRINKIHLYIFETQIGFLSFNIDYDLNKYTIEELIEANYNIKNLSSTLDETYYRKSISENETIDVKVNMGEIISKLTEDLMISTYFENETGLPKQSIIYSSLCLDAVNPEKNFIEHSLYKMRRSFNKSYIPTLEDLKIGGNEETMQTFENCYWGASIEGLANIYYLTDNEETNEFFTGVYRGAIEKTYLYIYIIALHQRYALLNYSIIASQIKKTMSFGMEDLDIVNEIKKEKIKIAYYNLRCAFKNLSNITHQNKVYYLMRRTLNLDDLSDEVHNELLGLAEVLEEHEEKIRKENEKENSKREKQRFNFLTIAVASLSAFFWLPSIVATTWDIINKIIGNKIPLYGSPLILISILFPIIFVAAPMVIINIMHRRLKKIYKTNK